MSDAEETEKAAQLQALRDIQAAIADLAPEDRRVVDDMASKIRFATSTDPRAMMALALVGAEISSQ